MSTGKRFTNQFNKNVARLKELQQAYSILKMFDQQAEISVELIAEGEDNPEPIVVFGNRPEIGQTGPESKVR